MEDIAPKCNEIHQALSTVKTAADRRKYFLHCFDKIRKIKDESLEEVNRKRLRISSNNLGISKAGAFEEESSNLRISTLFRVILSRRCFQNNPE